MSASSLANGVLNTPLQVWEFLRDEGGIDVKRYDESLVGRFALNQALAPSHLPTGDIEVILQAVQVCKSPSVPKHPILTCRFLAAANRMGLERRPLRLH